MEILGFNEINLKNDDLILDVREELEVNSKKCLLKNTVNIPLSQFDKADMSALKNAKGTIYILCKSGIRAQSAYAILQKDFKNLCVIKGGIISISKEFVEQKRKYCINITQQVFITIAALNLLGFAGYNYLLSGYFLLIPLFTSFGMLFAGTTGICFLEKVLLKAPWNKIK